jgi:hypothetical protein
LKPHDVDQRAASRPRAEQSVVDFIRAENYEPLSSPTFAARLDGIGDVDVEVLREGRARIGWRAQWSDFGPDLRPIRP